MKKYTFLTAVIYKIVCRMDVKNIDEEIQSKLLGALLESNGDEFLNYIMSDYEAWIAYFTPETKRQSSEWNHLNSPTKPHKIGAKKY